MPFSLITVLFGVSLVSMMLFLQPNQAIVISLIFLFLPMTLFYLIFYMANKKIEEQDFLLRRLNTLLEFERGKIEILEIGLRIERRMIKILEAELAETRPSSAQKHPKSLLKEAQTILQQAQSVANFNHATAKGQKHALRRYAEQLTPRTHDVEDLVNVAFELYTQSAEAGAH